MFSDLVGHFVLDAVVSHGLVSPAAFSNYFPISTIFPLIGRYPAQMPTVRTIPAIPFALKGKVAFLRLMNKA